MIESHRKKLLSLCHDWTCKILIIFGKTQYIGPWIKCISFNSEIIRAFPRPPPPQCYMAWFNRYSRSYITDIKSDSSFRSGHCITFAQSYSVEVCGIWVYGLYQYSQLLHHRYGKRRFAFILERDLRPKIILNSTNALYMFQWRARIYWENNAGRDGQQHIPVSIS